MIFRGKIFRRVVWRYRALFVWLMLVLKMGRKTLRGVNILSQQSPLLHKRQNSRRKNPNQKCYAQKQQECGKGGLKMEIPDGIYHITQSNGKNKPSVKGDMPADIPRFTCKSTREQTGQRKKIAEHNTRTKYAIKKCMNIELWWRNLPKPNRGEQR